MTARWARAAAVCSAATMVLFVVALLAFNTIPGTPSASGPYARPLRIGLVAVGVVLAAVTAWRYERLARGRFEGRPQWRVFTAWWALVVISLLIVVKFPPSPWAIAAWTAALGWGITATHAARLHRRSHP